MKRWIGWLLALLLMVSLSTVAWCDEKDVIVEAGPSYEIVEVTVGERYDETYGQLETLTIIYAPAETTVDTVAVVLLGTSAVFLVAIAWLRRKR